MKVFEERSEFCIGEVTDRDAVGEAPIEVVRRTDALGSMPTRNRLLSVVIVGVQPFDAWEQLTEKALDVVGVLRVETLEERLKLCPHEVLSAIEPVVERLPEESIFLRRELAVDRREEHPERLDEQHVGDVDFTGNEGDNELDGVGNPLRHAGRSDVRTQVPTEPGRESVHVGVVQLDPGKGEHGGHSLEGHRLQFALVGRRKFEGNLNDLLDEAGSGAVGVGVALRQRLGDHLLIEGKDVGRVIEVGGKFHEFEDRGDLAVIETVDVVDHDEDALTGILQELL